jgi:RNA polymerase sigma-70 factor (ECF subfamily)
VITLTRNRAIDRLRAQQRRTRIEGEIELDHFSSDPSDAVALTEEGKLALQALQRLRRQDREIIELTFFHSLTQTEISERLQQPLGTIKSRMRRSMLKLRDLMRIRPKA